MPGWPVLRWSSVGQCHFWLVPSVCGFCTVIQPPGRAENSYAFCCVDSWVGVSQPTFRPAFEGLNWAVCGWSYSSTAMGADCNKMKTLLGQIITVSDVVGQSVTHGPNYYLQHHSFILNFHLLSVYYKLLLYFFNFGQEKSPCFPFSTNNKKIIAKIYHP